MTPLFAGPFSAILADPAWTWKPRSDKGLGKSAQRHYDCMSLDDIKALDVAGVAAKDCALFMWATFPMLPQALDVMAAWGFTYKSGGAWGKQSKTGRKLAFGTGYIFRGAAEVLLVGTRGNPKWPSKSEGNLWLSPIREHSRKPDAVAEMIERQCPGPKLEMFSRESRPGNWTV